MSSTVFISLRNTSKDIMIVTEVLNLITILHKLLDTFTHGAGYCVNDLKDTDDYELYDPRIHSTLRGKIEGNANFNQAYDRGPILVNRPPKGTKTKQEVCIINCIFKLGTFFYSIASQYSNIAILF